jgi:hypothetical protein
MNASDPIVSLIGDTRVFPADEPRGSVAGPDGPCQPRPAPAAVRQRDVRVIAALMILQDQLGLVLAELLAGELGEDDRRALSAVLALLAADLAPSGVSPGDPAAT